MQKTTIANLYLLLIIILTIFISLFFGKFIYTLPIALQLIASQIGTLFLPLVLFFIITRYKITNLCHFKKISFVNIVLIILMSLFVQPLLSFMSALSTLLFPNAVTELVVELNQMPAIIAVALAAGMPAIFEELTFRGVIFSLYEHTGLKTAIVLNGLLFGIIHLNGNQFFYAAAMGIFFSYLVYKTRSIFSSMLAHFTINASQTLMMKMVILVSENQGLDIQEAISESVTLRETIVTIVSVGVLAALLTPFFILFTVLFIKCNKKEPCLFADVPDGKQENFFNWPFVLIAVIFLILAIIMPLLKLI